MDTRVVVALALLASLLLPAAGAGQQGHPLPAVGSHGLTFSLPEGGGAGFGIRKMTSERKSVGVELQVGVAWHRFEEGGDEEHSQTSFSLGVAPDLRLYRRGAGPVVPFLELSGRAGYQASDSEAWAVNGSAGVGLGVEWIPLPSMSVSGSTGMALVAQYADSGASSQTRLNLGAFRSRISLNLYF